MIMRNLSIEQKAKRYDEALEVLHKYDGANIMFSQSLKEEMFPELKESKDERIRKWLIEIVEEIRKTNSTNAGHNGMCSDAIAWLENQNQFQCTRVGSKEETSALKKMHDLKTEMITPEESLGIDSETYNKIVDECIYSDEQKPTEFSENRSKELSLSLQIQAYLNTASDELYAEGKPLHSETRIEDIHECMLMWVKLHNAYFYQKSAEWSEEDEKFFKTALWHISYSISKGKSTDFHCDTTEWFKSLKERVTSQPKQDWSENDEEMFGYALDMIEWYSGKYENKSRLVSNWLKSIKDRVYLQPQWKPSDTEINILQGVIDGSFKPENVKVTLTNILEQLKNLREDKLS